MFIDSHYLFLCKSENAPSPGLESGFARSLEKPLTELPRIHLEQAHLSWA